MPGNNSALLVRRRVVVGVMAGHVALPMAGTRRVGNILQAPALGGPHNRCSLLRHRHEIDQVRAPPRAVCIMTDRARGALIDYVLLMGEPDGVEQYGASVVAFIAKRVARIGLRTRVHRLVFHLKDRLETRAVRPARRRAALRPLIVVVTIRAADHAGRVILRYQAGPYPHVSVGSRHRVI